MASTAGAQIVDPSLFRLLVELETRKAQRMRYVVSLVCLGVDATGPAAVPASALVEGLATGIRATDAIAAAKGSETLTLLLVDAEDTDLPTLMDRLTPRLDNVRWSAGGACFPRTATTAGELLSQAQAMMKEAKRLGAGRLQLPR